MGNSDTMAWVPVEALTPRLKEYISASEAMADVLLELQRDLHEAYAEYANSYGRESIYWMLSRNPYPDPFTKVSKAKRLAGLCESSKNGDVLIGDADLSFVKELDPNYFENQASSLRGQAESYRQMAAKNREEALAKAEQKSLDSVVEEEPEQVPRTARIIAIIGIITIVFVFLAIITGNSH